jgi:uncharacterized protein
MKCPNCSEIDLLMSERQGIEIDYCPKCRGVWLDRGELDKFIQQSDQYTPGNTQQENREAQPPKRPMPDYTSSYESRTDNRYDRQLRDDNYDDDRYSQRGKKRESFLSNLFDFD